VAARIKFNYEAGDDGHLRPYLHLDLVVAGRGSIRMRGLLDSGVDVTVLPDAMIQVLKLPPEELVRVSAVSWEGRITVNQSATDVLAGLPAGDWVVKIRPIFHTVYAEPHWGRDFMGLYGGVAFDEKAKQFSLFAP
jgi:hypothetical protein